MSIRTYTNQFGGTPQDRPILGKNQVKNSAGGFSFPVDNWVRLDRFLILGSEGGSYYASERDLTVSNTVAVLECLKEDGVRVVKRVTEISQEGRAPKNDPAIFVLALALKKGDVETKKWARNAVPKVCRIGTHIFQLSSALKSMGTWSKAARKGVQNWYRNKSEKDLSYQVIKYRSREGWTHKDVLRVCHPKPTPDIQNVLSWVAEKEVEKVPPLIQKFLKAQSTEKAKDIVKLISEYSLPREAIPTNFLTDVSVWDALLQSGKGMPTTAMIRNLGKMTQVGLLSPLSEASKFVVKRLGDEETLKKARIHPLSVLTALAIYKQGKGMRGSLAWSPVKTVLDALDGAFYKTFKYVVPTGKRWLLALDVSASMTWGNIAGSPLTPSDGTAAMCMVTARTEPEYHIVGFSSTLRDIQITAKSNLDQAIRAVQGLPHGGTDCSLPMNHALSKKIPVDVFVVYTDNETWVGRENHPIEALQKYRDGMGIPAKLVVVGMVSNGFSIADPDDGGMLDVVGFDAATPNIISDFAR